MADYNQSEIRRFRDRISSEYHVYSKDAVLKPIVEAVIEEAAETAYNAGMGGMHSDNGASQMVDGLKMFLQGVAYGNSHDADNLGTYRQVYRDIQRKEDPDYKEYLRLKALFEDEDD
jgi:hypothetical protein